MSNDKIVIDETRAVNLLRDVVKRFGSDHSVRECVYVTVKDNGTIKGHCIVGNALIDAGLDPNWFAENKSHPGNFLDLSEECVSSVDSWQGQSADKLPYDKWNIEITPKAVEIFTVAQCFQDQRVEDLENCGIPVDSNNIGWINYTGYDTQGTWGEALYAVEKGFGFTVTRNL